MCVAWKMSAGSALQQLLPPVCSLEKGADVVSLFSKQAERREMTLEGVKLNQDRWLVMHWRGDV